MLHRNGTPSWVRTSDLRLRSPLLYPAELSGRMIYCSKLCKRKLKGSVLAIFDCLIRLRATSAQHFRL